MSTVTLIDKALLLGNDMELTETGDFKVVTNLINHLQAAQNRCLSLLSSWRFDVSNYGNEMGYYLEEKTPFQLTNEIARTFIEQALRPMLLDGRITELKEVTILEKTTTDVVLKIDLQVWSQAGAITIEVNNFWPDTITPSNVTNI